MRQTYLSKLSNAFSTAIGQPCFTIGEELALEKYTKIDFEKRLSYIENYIKFAGEKDKSYWDIVIIELNKILLERVS